MADLATLLQVKTGDQHPNENGAVSGASKWVQPNSLGSSYLLYKLEGNQADVGGAGVQMPKNGTPFSSQDIDLVKDRILGGAQ